MHLLFTPFQIFMVSDADFEPDYDDSEQNAQRIPQNQLRRIPGAPDLSTPHRDTAARTPSPPNKRRCLTLQRHSPSVRIGSPVHEMARSFQEYNQMMQRARLMFEMGFPGYQYPETSSADVGRGINEYLARQYQKAIPQEPETSEISVAGEISKASAADPPSTTAMSSSSVNNSMHESLRGKTIGEVILTSDCLRTVQDIVSVPDEELAHLKCKLQERDEIALAIGKFPLLHRQSNGEYAPYAEGFRLGMNLHVDIFALMSLLDNAWLEANAIDGVIAELAVLSSGVQLMSSEMAFYVMCKLERDLPVEISDVIHLRPDTHTLIFPFNLSNNHWCVAKAAFRRDRKRIKVYNSSPGLETSLAQTWLPKVLDSIINLNSNVRSNTNPVPLWSDRQWDWKPVVQGRSLSQTDNSSCGLYAIFNTLALLQEQKPSQEPVNPKALRVEYARALVRAVLPPLN